MGEKKWIFIVFLCSCLKSIVLKIMVFQEKLLLKKDPYKIILLRTIEIILMINETISTYFTIIKII